MRKLFPISIILLYPFPIYALQNDVSINTVILVSLSLIGFSLFYLLKFKLRFTKVQLGCYFIIVCIVISCFLGKTIAHVIYRIQCLNIFYICNSFLFIAYRVYSYRAYWLTAKNIITCKRCNIIIHNISIFFISTIWLQTLSPVL